MVIHRESEIRPDGIVGEDDGSALEHVEPVDRRRRWTQGRGVRERKRRSGRWDWAWTGARGRVMGRALSRSGLRRWVGWGFVGFRVAGFSCLVGGRVVGFPAGFSVRRGG